MNATALTAAHILAIPVLEPERLFGSPDAITGVYHALAKRWHPDAEDGDATVFAHIGQLVERAKHLASAGMWHLPGAFEFTAAGKQYRVRYHRAFDFELGKVLFGQTRLTYVIRQEFAEQAANARTIIGKLTYPDDKTREVMGRYLPKVIEYHETTTDVVVSIEKPADLIRLRDLLTHLGTIDAKHVAWMVSRMLNLASYLENQKLCHHDFSLDTLFTSPEHHSLCLLGGWWYAASAGSDLKGKILPARTIANGPSSLIATKIATLRTDPELIRLTGRELLGDASGISLASNPDIRPEIASWLRMSGTGSALQDFTVWFEKALGKRRFVVLPVKACDVYPELNP
jgi:hypothetical protein